MNILHHCGRRAAKRFAGVALALTTAATMLAAPAAHAATTTVPCNTAALIAALAAPPAPGDVINLAKHCTYTLTDVFPAPNPDGFGLVIDVASPGLTIHGNGATITRSKAQGTPDFPILENDGFLTMDHLTIKGGRIDQVGAPVDSAAGIENFGVFIGSGLRVTGNVARATDTVDVSSVGGGVDNEGTMTLDQSTVDHNSVVAACVSVLPCAAASGAGGIFANGDVTAVTNTTMSDNTAKAYGNFQAVGLGGGILAVGGDVTLDHDAVRHNTAAGFSSGQSSLAGGGGGAFLSVDSTTVSVTGTTVAGNSAQATGAMVDVAAGGGFLNGAADVPFGTGPVSSLGEGSTLTGDTDHFTGNSAVSVDTPGGAALGGGFADAEGTACGSCGSATFTDTTFTKNRSSAKEGVGQGGGIAVVLSPPGTVTLDGGSVTKNVASGGAGGEGGGIFTDNPSSVVLGATTPVTVSKNKPDNCFPHGTITNCVG